MCVHVDRDTDASCSAAIRAIGREWVSRLLEAAPGVRAQQGGVVPLQHRSGGGSVAAVELICAATSTSTRARSRGKKSEAKRAETMKYFLASTRCVRAKDFICIVVVQYVLLLD